MKRHFFMLIVLMVAGCAAPAPGQNAGVAASSGAYPQILPLDSVLAGVPDGTLTTATGQSLKARAARLHALARAMQNRPVLDDTSKQLLIAALAKSRR